MRKFQYPHEPIILPSINQCTSRKVIKNLESNTSKENQHPIKDHMNKIRLLPSHFCLPKKYQSKDYAANLDQFLQIKLLEPIKTDVPTIHKLNKPWVAKNVDMNKETTKNNQLQAIINKERISHVLKRKGNQNQKQRGNSLNLVQKTLSKGKLIEKQASKISKAQTKRNIAAPRQKTYSCRIALKNCVFPIHQKKYDKAKLLDFFANDDTLSTISKRQESDSEDVFITFDSYTDMLL